MAAAAPEVRRVETGLLWLFCVDPSDVVGVDDEVDEGDGDGFP